MSGKSYVEKLLDGVTVEWLPLGNLAEIYGGLTGKSKSDFEQGNANYITYKNIFSNIEINPDVFEKVKISPSEKQHKVQYGDILFTGSSEIANEAGISSAVTTKFDEEVYLNSFSFGVRFKSNANITPEFAKYLFRCSFMRLEISKTASGVTRFNISKERFKKILIPVLCPDNPKKSLEIQAEIVRILDAFTAHTAELTAELTARKKQYHYYRDKLLSFEEGDVEWKPLKNVGNWYGGGTPSKLNPEYWENGTIPWISPKDMGRPVVESTEDRITEKAVAESSTKLVPANAIAVVVRSSILDKRLPTAFVPAPSALNQDMKAVIPNNDVDVKYLAHVLRSRGDDILRVARKSGGSVASIDSTKLFSFRVPVPCLDKQRQIAAILDKFDALTNSITEGLPREIELRQKQYAYYRDLLLSFPKPLAERKGDIE